MIEYIELEDSKSNEDVASLSIVHNTNMDVIKNKINQIIDELNGVEQDSGEVRTKIIVQTNEQSKEDDNYLITKTISNNVCIFVITSKKGRDMEFVIVDVRTSSNERILCPIRYEKTKITIVIDNLKDVEQTNVIAPQNDVNNKVFILI